MDRKSCAKSVPIARTCQVQSEGGACRQAAGTKVKDIKRQGRLTIYSASQKAIYCYPEVCKYPFSFHCFFSKGPSQ